MKKISVAFVGTRHPHMWHRVELLKVMQQSQVIGFYDEDPYYACGFAQRTGFARFVNLEDLLNQKPDLCIIESMDFQTPALALKVAPHTRAMILEKCTAPTWEENRDLAAKLSMFPVHIDHGFQLHYLEILDEIRSILGSGALGQVTLARFHGGSPCGCSTEMWVTDSRLMGGMVYIEGSHMIEIMLDTLGVPNTITGKAIKLAPGEELISSLRTTDLFAGAGVPPIPVRIGEMAYEDVGVGIAVYCDKIAVLDLTAWEGTDWCNGWRMEYYGTNGSLVACPLPSWLELTLSKPAFSYQEGKYRRDYPLLSAKNETQMRQTYRRQLNYMFSLLTSNANPDQRGMKTICDVARTAKLIYGETAPKERFSCRD